MLQVPEGDYEVELGKARIVQAGSDITLIGWGGQVHVLQRAANRAAELGVYFCYSLTYWYLYA